MNGTLGYAKLPPAFVVVPLVAAGLAGIAIAAAPWQASAIAIVVLAGMLLLALSKAALRPVEPRSWLEATASRQGIGLSLARKFYYLGAATIGFLTIRPALAFTASDWIFFLAFGVTCLALLAQRTDREFLIPRAITYGVVLFSLGGLVSSYHALAPIQSVSIVVRLLYLTIVWFWLGTIVLQNHRHVENALVAWVVSAALSASGAVAQFFYGDVIAGGGVAWGRMTGFTPHFNSLGGLAATAFVPALMLAADSRRPPVRLLGFGSVGLLCAGLLLSGSVGGLLAVVVSTMFWFTIRGITWGGVLGLAGVTAASFALMSATGYTSSPHPLERINRVTSAQEAAAGTGGSLYTRLDGYAQAWEQIKQDPFVGVGLDDASSQELFGDKLVHNMLINPWATAGVFGLIGIMLMVGGAAAVGCEAVRHAPPLDRSFTSALLASIVAFVVFGMGEPILFVRYGWFPVALLVALRAQRLRAEAPRTQHVRAHGRALGYLPAG